MTVDPKRRLIWLRTLRRFKYGIRVRAKLGVLQVISEHVGAQRKGQSTWDQPEWTHDKWVSYLYVCLRDNEYPYPLLEAFVKTAEVTFFSTTCQPTEERVLEAVDGVLKQLSKPLRQRFGVIT